MITKTELFLKCSTYTDLIALKNGITIEISEIKRFREIR